MNNKEDNQQIQEEISAQQQEIEVKMELQRQIELLEKLEETERELKAAIVPVKKVAEGIEVKEQSLN